MAGNPIWCDFDIHTLCSIRAVTALSFYCSRNLSEAFRGCIASSVRSGEVTVLWRNNSSQLIGQHLGVHKQRCAPSGYLRKEQVMVRSMAGRAMLWRLCLVLDPNLTDEVPTPTFVAAPGRVLPHTLTSSTAD